MARADALGRLHTRLESQGDNLRDQLAGQRSRRVRHEVGDAGDAAIEGYESEIDSQLAAFEAGELRKIDAAIRAIRDGRYGSCTVCEKNIPIERLKAMPYSTMCVKCQSEDDETGVHTRRAIAREWTDAYAATGEEAPSPTMAQLVS